MTKVKRRFAREQLRITGAFLAPRGASGGCSPFGIHPKIENAATKIDETFSLLYPVELHRAEARRPDSNRQLAGYEPCSSIRIRCKVMADRAGLEPATFRLTIGHSGHLSYLPKYVRRQDRKDICSRSTTELHGDVHHGRIRTGDRVILNDVVLSAFAEVKWLRREDSNLRPKVYETLALRAELHRQNELVRRVRFELTHPSLKRRVPSTNLATGGRKFGRRTRNRYSASTDKRTRLFVANMVRTASHLPSLLYGRVRFGKLVKFRCRPTSN